jgi:hypothetical protein
LHLPAAGADAVYLGARLTIIFQRQALFLTKTGGRIKLSDRISMGDGLEIRDAKNNNPSTIISVMIKDGHHVKTADKGDTLLAGNFEG